MAEIKAIQTQYNGYKFRSRLEARWAVFFDEIGIKYEYEKEGYNLGALGWYLPDFYLPEFELWVEIKPNEASEVETVFAYEKAKKLFGGTNKPVLLCFGLPKKGQCVLVCNTLTNAGGGEDQCLATFVANDLQISQDEFIKQRYLLVDEEFDGCSIVNYEWESLNKNIGTKSQFEWTDDVFSYWEFSDLDSSAPMTLSREAAIKARQARFEHGEKG